jgi:hypothetical protein
VKNRLQETNLSDGETPLIPLNNRTLRTSGPDHQDPRAAELISAMEESMDRFEETYRLLATEALSDDPAP